MMYEDDVTKKIAQEPEDEMLKHTVLSPWLEQLRNEHPERAQRMINDNWKGGRDITQDLIEVILLDPLKEPSTSREEWAEIKAKAIVKMLKGE